MINNYIFENIFEKWGYVFLSTYILLDNLDQSKVSYISIKSLSEKGRRLPIHSIHRWWSRRYSALYRGILSAYLIRSPDKHELFYSAFEDPRVLSNFAKGKTFFEPFCGGGTGLVEASLMGFNVWGIDINPLAAEISRAALNIIKSGNMESKYAEASIKILDEALKQLENFWIYNGQIVSYVHITRTKRVPTWVSTFSEEGKKYKILRCPHCAHVFSIAMENRNSNLICPHCGSEFLVTYKPKYKIRIKNLPKESNKWYAWAVELRNPKNNWEKRLLMIEDNNDIGMWLSEGYESINNEIDDVIKLLNALNLSELKEGRRLQREGVSALSELYLPRQILSYKIVSILAKKLPVKLRKIFSLAVSESAKSSCIAVRWHPPISEPVPAVTMKTYWIPEYTVETNPLAHVWGTLKSLARNTIASSVRTQIRAMKETKKRKVKSKVVTGNALETGYPQRIDIAVIDPPYNDRISSYASLAIVHYGVYEITRRYAFDNKNSILSILPNIEQSEIHYDRERFKKLLLEVTRRAKERLKDDGRVIFMYSQESYNSWKAIFDVMKRVNLFPTIIFWTLGETPGGLARSQLRGIFVIVAKKNMVKSTKIIFEDILKDLKDYVTLHKEAEMRAYKELVKAFNDVFSEQKLKKAKVLSTDHIC